MNTSSVPYASVLNTANSILAGLSGENPMRIFSLDRDAWCEDRYFIPKRNSPPAGFVDITDAHALADYIQKLPYDRDGNKGVLSVNTEDEVVALKSALSFNTYEEAVDVLTADDLPLVFDTLIDGPIAVWDGAPTYEVAGIVAAVVVMNDYAYYDTGNNAIAKTAPITGYAVPFNDGTIYTTSLDEPDLAGFILPWLQYYVAKTEQDSVRRLLVLNQRPLAFNEDVVAHEIRGYIVEFVETEAEAKVAAKERGIESYYDFAKIGATFI